MKSSVLDGTRLPGPMSGTLTSSTGTASYDNTVTHDTLVKIVYLAVV